MRKAKRNTSETDRLFLASSLSISALQVIAISVRTLGRIRTITSLELFFGITGLITFVLVFVVNLRSIVAMHVSHRNLVVNSLVTVPYFYQFFSYSRLIVSGRGLTLGMSMNFSVALFFIAFFSFLTHRCRKALQDYRG